MNKRKAARVRLVEGFLASAQSALQDVQLMLESDDDPDIIDSAVAELERLEQTALSLELKSIAEAMAAASEVVQSGEDSDEVLRAAAASVRRDSRGNRRLGAILVWCDGSQAEILVRDSEVCPEKMCVFSTAEELQKAIDSEPVVDAVAVPASEVKFVTRLSKEEPFPVLAYGAPSDWDERLAASEAGASGHLSTPFSISDLTSMARLRSRSDEVMMEVLILAERTVERQRLQHALEAQSINAVTTEQPSELMPGLDTGLAQAVLLGAKVGGVDAKALAVAVRNHPRCAHIPILVVGRPDDPAALRRVGVDDVMRANADPVQMASRVRDRILRIRTLPRTMDAASGMRNKAGILTEVERHMALARRSHGVIGIGMIEIAGLHNIQKDCGPGPVRKARRILGAQLRRVLRNTDVYGELLPGMALAALPTANAHITRRRMQDVVERMKRAFARDSNLSTLTINIGSSDSEAGLERIVQRAEADLNRS